MILNFGKLVKTIKQTLKSEGLLIVDEEEKVDGYIITIKIFNDLDYPDIYNITIKKEN